MRKVITVLLILIVASSGCNQEDYSTRESYGHHPATAASSRWCDRVLEYRPAPGQFINSTELGFTGGETDMGKANEYAFARLTAGELSPVSLGAFGGYIVVGFDHSVQAWGAAAGGYDFSITGNQISGGSEPGVVWVKQDLNGNGQPDEEEPWYELMGSEYWNPDTRCDYSVTYFRPNGDGEDIRWEDSKGATGAIKYLADYHDQPSYYPKWLEGQEEYTLTGVCLPPRGKYVEVNGEQQFVAGDYEWGYADNWGATDRPDGGMKTFFKISDAVVKNSNGRRAELKYIDFIMVQTAVNGEGGQVGELSTEVCRFTDENLGL